MRFFKLVFEKFIDFILYVGFVLNKIFINVLVEGMIRWINCIMIFFIYIIFKDFRINYYVFVYFYRIDIFFLLEEVIERVSVIL